MDITFETDTEQQSLIPDEKKSEIIDTIQAEIAEIRTAETVTPDTMTENITISAKNRDQAIQLRNDLHALILSQLSEYDSKYANYLSVKVNLIRDEDYAPEDRFVEEEPEISWKVRVGIRRDNGNPFRSMFRKIQGRLIQ